MLTRVPEKRLMTDEEYEFEKRCEAEAEILVETFKSDLVSSARYYCDEGFSGFETPFSPSTTCGVLEQLIAVGQGLA